MTKKDIQNKRRQYKYKIKKLGSLKLLVPVPFLMTRAIRVVLGCIVFVGHQFFEGRIRMVMVKE